ncbi:hypothetical protein ACFQ0I_13460 [Mariniflexile aquimaris]|uniref:CXXC-20-CXXC protein n=1 Tax=Mariniflexile aquimaris TaxID=881009 RepID=A0ABW3BW00_9FLAO
MKLFATCLKCKHELSFNSDHKTRVEFVMHEGKIKVIECYNCHHKNLFIVNDLYAKKSKLAFVIASIIFLVGTPFLIYYIPIFLLKNGGIYSSLIIGGFMLIPIIVYSTILKEDRIRVNTFNRGYYQYEPELKK